MDAATDAAAEVLRCDELPPGALAALLARLGLRLRQVAAGAPIPHSYWGAPEAGIRGDEVFVRGDTPVHSALHEAAHLVCARPRGAVVDTDAGGDFDEENAVLYLQVLLADALPGAGAARMLADMDRWGYTFRLGSAARWFHEDAEEARRWLVARGLETGASGAGDSADGETPRRREA